MERLFVLFINGHIVFARMVAGGTYGGRLCADKRITADKTAPGDGFVALPYRTVLYLLQITGETVVVVLFD